MSVDSVSLTVICDLLKGSILELCRTSVPKADGVEVDAIVCISLGKHTTDQLVIKIHEALWRNKDAIANVSQLSPNENGGGSSQKIKDGDKRSVNSPVKVAQRPNKRKSGCPISIVNAKKSCLEYQDRQDSESSQDDQPMQESATEANKSSVVKVKQEIIEDADTDVAKPICIEPSEVYICDVCKHCFSDHQSYTDHFVLSEKCQVTINVCSYCNLKLYDVKSYVLHLRKHTSEGYGEIWKGRPVRCGVCTILLRSKRSITEHMSSSHQHVKCYSCTTCEEIYPDFKTFRLHRQEKHSSTNQCRCDMCELFFTFTEFKEHEKECKIKIHTEEVVMPSTNTEYYSTPSTGIHHSPSAEAKDYVNSDTKMNIRNSVTPVCESRDASDTSAMMDTPTLGPFRCQKCFMVFQTFEQYETHNHEMHSRHVCSYCAQSFATRRNLQRHARRHTGVRPYRCQDCGVTFTRDDDLKKHMFKNSHLTGYKGKSPVRPVAGSGATGRDGDSGVMFHTESSNEGSVIIHQSQEPEYVQVQSNQEEAIEDRNGVSRIDDAAMNDAARKAVMNGNVVVTEESEKLVVL